MVVTHIFETLNHFRGQLKCTPLCKDSVSTLFLVEKLSFCTDLCFINVDNCNSHFDSMIDPFLKLTDAYVN